MCRPTDAEKTHGIIVDSLGALTVMQQVCYLDVTIFTPPHIVIPVL